MRNLRWGVNKMGGALFWSAAALALLAAFCWAQNNWIVTKRYVLYSRRIQAPMRIVQLSDLHGKRFGRQNRRLLGKIQRQKPDLIAFTGDFADRFRLPLDAAYTLMEQLVKIAPVVYCPGNHEYGRRDREQIFSELERLGVHVLRQRLLETETKGNLLAILGADEVGYGCKTEDRLAALEQNRGFRLLLAHFPHYFEPLYCRYKTDLILAGHAHGGQFWFPGGGIYAPGQGLFPKYCKGVHEKNGARMIVSRGLGNSGFPLRLFNFPQLVAVTLLPENEAGEKRAGRER